MIRLSIRRPVAIAMTYLAIGLLGVAAWRNLPIELLPDTDLPRLTVSASLPGASPEVTEAFLTAPLEAEIQQIRGIENLTSESFETNGMGTASITAEFALDTDMDFARLELSERMAALAEKLPARATRPQVADYVPDEFRQQTRPFLSYTLSGPFTLETLREYVDDELTPELLRVDGVAAATASGGRRRMLEIALSPARIEALGLTPQRVESAVRGLEIVRSAGRVTQGGVVYTLALRERADDLAEIRGVPLLTEGGRLVRLGDVAEIYDSFEAPRSYYRIDGEPAVTFRVTREIGSNAVAVADAVKARIAALEAMHPPGVRLHLDDDQSREIRAQLSDLRTRAIVAAVVIFVVLLLFLRAWRSAAIVFASIAFSILITLNILYWAGYSLNVLTLMGLAMGFGLIVDNAIVVLENVYRHRRAGEPAAVAAERGAREVVLPVLAATLTTLVVLIPFVYLQGELRIYYVPLALVVGFSLIGSLFVAFSFIPALGSRILGIGERPTAAGQDTLAGERVPAPPAPPTRRRSPVYVRFYSGFTGWTLRHPWITAAVAVLMLGGSWHLFDKYVTRGVVWGRFGGGQDTYIRINIELPRGEELARMEELARHFENRLKAMPEVERFVTNVDPRYANITATFPDSIANSWIPVAIKEQMVAYSLGFGGAEVRVIGYGPSFYGGGSSPPNYSIQVLGYNFERVREIAEDLSRRLLRFSRIQEVDPNAAGGFQQDKATELVLRLNRDRLAMHGLTPAEVVSRVTAAVSTAADRRNPMQLAGEELLFSVKLQGFDRLDMLALQELLIPSRTGQGVRLGSVATLEERDVQPRILRENQQYQRTVAYEFRGPVKLGDVVRDAVIAATDLPPGYSIEEGGGWGWSQEEKEQIYGVLVVSLLLVFMVTAALFESVRQPLVVLLSVPMALIGVFLTFFYAEASFTREAYIGVIMMGGIVVNNSILLVDHINAVRREGRETLEGAILRATLERVRPILMTTATTVVGLLPLVLFSDTADQNIWNALAYALIGGLTSSTMLVLTVTPALYLLFERRAQARSTSLAMASLCLLCLVGSACSPSGETPDESDSAETWTLTEDLRIESAPGTDPGEFGASLALEAGSDGTLYVADPQNYRILVFDSTGAHQRTLGGRGSGPGELLDVIGLRLHPDGNLWAADLGNGRFTVYGRDGTVVETAPFDGFHSVPWKGLIDREGRIHNLVLTFREEGPRLAYVRDDGSVRDTLLLPPYTAVQQRITSATGQERLVNVPFAPRPHWAIDREGSLWFGFSDVYRVFRIGYDGDTISALRQPDAAVSLTPAERATAVELMRGPLGEEARVDESWIPATRPQFESLEIDDRNRLWVGVPEAGGRIRYEVFAFNGELIVRAVHAGPAPPPRSMLVRGGHLYAITVDELDLPRVIRYRIDAK